MKYFLLILIVMSSCSTTKQIKTNLKPSLKDEINISIVDGFGNDSVYLIK